MSDQVWHRHQQLIRGAWVLTLASLSLYSLSSWAQVRRPQTHEGRERAYQLIERAEREVGKGALRGAISLYERAYRALPELKILWRIAQLSDNAQLSCAARLRAWERLSMSCAHDECSPSWAVHKGYERAQRQCEVRLKVELSQGAHMSHGGPLQVILDDELRGEAPLSLLTSAGEHRLSVYQGEVLLYDAPLTLSTLREGHPHTLTLHPTAQGKLSLKSLSSQRTSKRTPKRTPKRTLKRTPKHTPKHTHPSNPQKNRTAHHTSPHTKLIKGETSPTGIPFEHDPLRLEATLVCQYQEGGMYHDYPDCDGATLTEGDRFRLILKSSASAHLYLMMHNAHGERAVLFPDQGVPNQVRGGVSYLLPSEGWYELDERGGVTERLQLLASRRPLEPFEQARGLRVSDELMERLRRTAARGVVRRGAPATLSERLGALDRVLITEGSSELAAVRFTLEHR